MYKKLSRAKVILEELPDIPINPGEDLEKMQEMNLESEKVHKDFLYKEAMSEQSGAQVILF